MKKTFFLILGLGNLILFTKLLESESLSKFQYYSDKSQNSTSLNSIFQPFIMIQNDTLQTVTFFGLFANDNFGYSVASAGDVNGDGFSDVIIGSWGNDSYTGKAYIYFGSHFIDNIADVFLSGEASYNYFGGDVSGAGDVNNDGYSDVIVGAQGFNSLTGRSYVYYGGIAMDNIADVVFNGESSGNLFGISVSTAGDVNGDGYSDVIVGANRFNSDRGRAYIFYGGPSMNNVVDVVLNGEISNSYFSNSVSQAGDVNDDGYSDVIVGANRYNSSTGKAYLYLGGNVMDNIPDKLMIGESLASEFGWAVSGVGDINSDGYSDFVIGARRYNSGLGRAYLYSGGAVIDSVADVIMTGETSGSEFGWSVSGIGDVNGDGYSDAGIGAQLYSSSKGRTYIYYGSSAVDNVADVILTGESDNDFFGVSISDAGDVDANGYNDVVVGVHGYNSNSGKAVLYQSFVAKPIQINPINNSINNPTSVAFQWTFVPNTLSYKIQVATDSTFNNVILIDSTVTDTFKIIGGFQKEKKYYWRVGSKDGLGRTSHSAVWNFKTIPPLKLNLSMLFEGMYFPLFNQLSRIDSVVTYLRNSTSPYQPIDSVNAAIDSLTFSGSFVFSDAMSGQYYITLKHFNSIETWSKNGGESIFADGNFYNYNFTDSITHAYGNNLKLKGNKYCIFSGDINRDDFIDISDIVIVYNESVVFATGYRLPADLNGDTFVDLSDMTICYNNSRNFVGVIRP